MLKTSFITIAATLTLAMSAVAAPQIKWLKTIHQFGSFSEDLENVSCTFKGVNVGDEPLVIYDVKTNCGCTTTEKYAGEKFAPGDTLSITATYNASGRPGRFTKKLMVYTNAQPEKQTLTLAGTVIGTSNTLKSRYPVELGNLRLNSQTAVLGQAKKGRSPSSFIKVYNTTNDTLTPQVVKKPKYMNAVVEPQTVTPGEQFIVSFTYHTGQNSKWGLQTDTIAFVPMVKNGNLNDFEPIELTTIVTINEDFSKLSPEQLENAPKIALDPTIVDLHRVKIGSEPIKQRVDIGNTGNTQLIIRQITSVHPGLSFKLADTKVKPGKSIPLDITIDPSLNPNNDLIDARITIIANDPATPTTVLRVVGELVN